MEVLLAQFAGFCFGVKRAVDLVVQESKKTSVCTLGPIIHNKTVVNDFESLGVCVATKKQMEELMSNHTSNCFLDKTVVIRSHGVRPETIHKLLEKNIPFIDATCPFVSKIHHLVSDYTKKGYTTIVLGSKTHAEVEGICGHANDQAIVLETLHDACAFSFSSHCSYLVVAQTTFDMDLFAQMVDVLRSKCPNITVINTICHATKNNQHAARELSKKVDVMLVIGDRQSSNTKKLYDICKKNQPKTYLIETIHEIQLNIFSVGDKIGITAGASTPPATIKEAYQFMSEFTPEEKMEQTNEFLESTAGGVSEQNSEDVSFEQMLDDSMIVLHTGDVVKGTVISIHNGEVLINLGFKSDGIIQKGQFAEDKDVDPADFVKPGDVIDVFVVRVNDGDGNVLLSRKKVESQKGITELEEAATNGEPVLGKIVEVVKGGVMAMMRGVRVFVPSSQVSNRFVEDLKSLLGKEYNFNIIQFDKAKRKVVGGRKELAAKEALEAKLKLYQNIEEGQKITGKVSKITDFGAFVDLGGMDGLIHISALSWGKVKRVSDVLSEGQEVVVTVLSIDKEKNKISLSLRDVNGDPWKDAETKYAVSQVVQGKVVRMVPFGAFVQLDEGVDGLLHVSQISTKHVAKPEDALSIGDVVTVKITDIDLGAKKISLSIKALEENAVEESAVEQKEEKTQE